METLVHVDADLFGCIVRNLVSNAIKFTPEGGIIQIDGALSAGNCVFSISDTGRGIAPRDIKNMVSGKMGGLTFGLMNEKGSGFGLKLCHEFVHLCGGQLGLDPGYKKGTRFWFSIPMHR